jgi:hypothetical protein
MTKVLSRRPLASEAQFRSRVSPLGICGGQNGTGTGFSPNTSVSPCYFHSTGAPLHEKTKKLIIFITGLHNTSQGCGASVASAAGPFKKIEVLKPTSNFTIVSAIYKLSKASDSGQNVQ